MKVIFRQSVPNLGESGDVKEVSPGYFRNLCSREAWRWRSRGSDRGAPATSLSAKVSYKSGEHADGVIESSQVSPYASR